MLSAEKRFEIWKKRMVHISPIRVRGLTRKRLVEYFAEFGFNKGAEIGVSKGRFSKAMCKANPELKLICVDPWNTDYHNDYELEYQKAVKLLKPYGCKIIRDTSTGAVKNIEDRSLDFVYIDAEHSFDFVMMDLILWGEKVRYGGIISGHDYFKFRGSGVVEAVDTYTKMHKVHDWYTTDMHKEKAPSFFWIKTKDHDWDKIGHRAIR